MSKLGPALLTIKGTKTPNPCLSICHDNCTVAYQYSCLTQQHLTRTIEELEKPFSSPK